jgi:Flp pilus assembly protein TadG
MMLKAIRTRIPQGRTGAAAGELAFILPVLVLIVLGCVDLGRFVYSYIAVTNAARTAAGFGSSNPYTTATLSTWQAQVRQAAVDEMSGVYGFSDGSLTVTATPTTESAGFRRIQVDVSYPFQTMITWPGIPQNLTLQRRVIMRSIR